MLDRLTPRLSGGAQRRPLHAVVRPLYDRMPHCLPRFRRYLEVLIQTS